MCYYLRTLQTKFSALLEISCLCPNSFSILWCGCSLPVGLRILLDGLLSLQSSGFYWFFGLVNLLSAFGLVSPVKMLTFFFDRLTCIVWFYVLLKCFGPTQKFDVWTKVDILLFFWLSMLFGSSWTWPSLAFFGSDSSIWLVVSIFWAKFLVVLLSFLSTYRLFTLAIMLGCLLMQFG